MPIVCAGGNNILGTQYTNPYCLSHQYGCSKASGNIGTCHTILSVHIREMASKWASIWVAPRLGHQAGEGTCTDSCCHSAGQVKYTALRVHDAGAVETKTALILTSGVGWVLVPIWVRKTLRHSAGRMKYCAIKIY